MATLFNASNMATSMNSGGGMSTSKMGSYAYGAGMAIEGLSAIYNLGTQKRLNQAQQIQNQTIGSIGSYQANIRDTQSLIMDVNADIEKIKGGISKNQELVQAIEYEKQASTTRFNAEVARIQSDVEQADITRIIAETEANYQNYQTRSRVDSVLAAVSAREMAQKEVEDRKLKMSASGVALSGAPLEYLAETWANYSMGVTLMEKADSHERTMLRYAHDSNMMALKQDKVRRAMNANVAIASMNMEADSYASAGAVTRVFSNVNQSLNEAVAEGMRVQADINRASTAIDRANARIGVSAGNINISAQNLSDLATFQSRMVNVGRGLIRTYG